jgi:AsmA protein
MRKWIIAGGALLLLVVVVAVALVNLNTLINRNKDYLVAQAEAALGRRVTVGDIGVTLWGGIGASLKQFTLADDPSFSNEAFVRAADLQINMKLLPLLRKEFQVSKVILHRPAINVIKDQKGQYNFSTIGRDKERKEKPKETDREKKERSEDRAGPPPLIVSLVDIADGEIRYIDRSQGIDVRVSQLDFRIKDIRLDHPVDISLEAAVFGASKQNFKVKGRAGPLGPKGDLNNLPLEGDLELEPVPLATLDKTAPGFKQSLPPGLDLAGAVGAKARFSGSFGKNSLPQINGTLNLANVSARIPQLPQPITDVNAKINFAGKSAELPETSFRIGKSQIRLAANATSIRPLNVRYRLSAPELNLADLRAASPGRKKPEIIKDLKSEGTVLMQNGVLTHRGNLNSPTGTIADGDYTNLQTSTSFANRVLTIESLSLGAFGGALSARGRYDMRESTPRFAATTNVKGMDLTQIFRSLLPSAPQNIQGQLNMDLDVTGAGKERETIQKALKGQGRAEVLNGVLLDVNLADSVLSNTGIPGFASIVPADLKKKYPEVFSSKNTEFKQLKGSAIIKDGKAYTDDLIVAAAEFESLGKGWFAFDQTVDFRGQLFLSQPFSQDIISRAREMKGLANDQGRIEIPFTMSGKLPGAKPKPDLGYVAQALQKGAFDRGLDSFFRRRSRGGSETAPSQQDQPSGSQERKKRSPADEIRRGLEGLFGR